MATRTLVKATPSARAVERQIATFVAKYTPEIATATRMSRARLQAVFPRGHEIVYDNYNALVFGYSPTERASRNCLDRRVPEMGHVVSSARRQPRGSRGASTGNGKQVRGVKLESPADLDSPAIRALLKQAIAQRAREFRDAPALTTVVKSVSARQRHVGRARPANTATP